MSVKSLHRVVTFKLDETHRDEEAASLIYVKSAEKLTDGDIIMIVGDQPYELGVSRRHDLEAVKDGRQQIWEVSAPALEINRRLLTIESVADGDRSVRRIVWRGRHYIQTHAARQIAFTDVVHLPATNHVEWIFGDADTPEQQPCLIVSRPRYRWDRQTYHVHTLNRLGISQETVPASGPNRSDDPLYLLTRLGPLYIPAEWMVELDGCNQRPMLDGRKLVSLPRGWYDVTFEGVEAKVRMSDSLFVK